MNPKQLFCPNIDCPADRRDLILLRKGRIVCAPTHRFYQQVVCIKHVVTTINPYQEIPYKRNLNCVFFIPLQ